MRLQFIINLDVKPLSKYSSIDPIYRKELEKEISSQIRRMLEQEQKAVHYGDDSSFPMIREIRVEGLSVTIYNVAAVNTSDTEREVE